MIHQLEIVRKRDGVLSLAHDAIGLGIERRRRFPYGKLEGIARLEEDSELPALRPQPKPFLAPEDVDMRLQRAFGFLLGKKSPFNDLVVQPPEAGPAFRRGRAGHYATLILRNHGDLPLTVLQHDHISVLSEKLHIFPKGARFGTRVCSNRGDSQRA